MSQIENFQYVDNYKEENKMCTLSTKEEQKQESYKEGKERRPLSRVSSLSPAEK